MNFIQTILYMSLLITSAGCSQSLTKNEWTITYRKTDVFIGNRIIKIGTDSCYYESTFTYNSKPLIISWKSRGRKLNELWKKVAVLHLQQCSPVIATFTEEPFETIELLQNKKVVYFIQKEQQSVTDAQKFDSVVAILQSFVSAAHGWKY